MSDSEDDMYGSDSEASYGSGQEEESGGAAAASASSASAAPAPAMSAPRMYPPPFADAAAAMAGTGYTVLGRQVSYDVFSDDDLERQRDDLVDDFREVTGARQHVAVAVIEKYKYALEMAKSGWFEDSVRAMLRAKVVDEDDPPAKPSDWEGLEEVDCEVCFEEVPLAQMDGLPCGHWACDKCWTGHLVQSAESKAELLGAACMACSHPVTERLVRKALSDVPAKLARWKRWKFADFAAEDSATRACPNAGCAFVCRYPKGVARDVICPSGHIFCFACGMEGHNPASCDDAKQWRETLMSDSMDLKWIQSNCRPCPKCGLMIEKNQGCQFMRCGAHAHSGVIAKGSGCGFQFCWVCMNATSSGSHSNCKAWTPGSDTKMADTELQRFVQASAHFDGNMVGMREAMKLLPEVRETMLGLSRATALSLQKLSHLEEAVHEIAESRRTLAWSYIWQHYHGEAAGVRAALFLDNQGVLHSRVETLQRLVEGAPGEDPVSKAVLMSAPAGVSGEDMDALVRDGMGIRDLLSGVRRFREDVVLSVQICTSELESTGLAAAASAT